MTCIAAVRAADGSVWMGADSAASRCGTTVTLPATDAKIVDLGAALIGVSGLHATTVALRFGFTPPPYAGEDPFEWVAQQLAPAIKARLIEACVWSDSEEDGFPRGHGGHAIVAMQGRIFELSQVCCVGEIAEDYHAIGNGEDVAFGALRALLRHAPGVTPAEALTAALDAAAVHKDGVAGPFHIFVHTPHGR